MKIRWIDMDCHVAFAMLPGETSEQAEDRLIEALDNARMNLISWSNEEIEESDERPCEICQHSDCSMEDEPCVSCGDEGKGFEPLGGWSGLPKEE